MEKEPSKGTFRRRAKMRERSGHVEFNMGDLTEGMAMKDGGDRKEVLSEMDGYVYDIKGGGIIREVREGRTENGCEEEGSGMEGEESVQEEQGEGNLVVRGDILRKEAGQEWECNAHVKGKIDFVDEGNGSLIRGASLGVDFGMKRTGLVATNRDFSPCAPCVPQVPFSIPANPLYPLPLTSTQVLVKPSSRHFLHSLSSSAASSKPYSCSKPQFQHCAEFNNETWKIKSPFGAEPVAWTRDTLPFSHVSTTVLASALLANFLFIGSAGAQGVTSEGLSSGFESLKGITDGLLHLAESSGPYGAVYFTLSYILATLLLLPASVLTLAAGYLFGALKGTALVSLASTAGASLAFLIARYLARPLVARQLAKFERFGSVDRAIAKDGWKIVFLWRLSPLFPFALSNYMFGLTGVGFAEYVLASWVAMLPATFTYVYLGEVGRATVDAAGGDGIEPAKVALYIIGAIATLLVTREISSRAKKALDEADNTGPE